MYHQLQSDKYLSFLNIWYNHQGTVGNCIIAAETRFAKRYMYQTLGQQIYRRGGEMALKSIP